MEHETSLCHLVGEPPWHPLRERRVYARIRAELCARKTRRRQLRWLALASAAAAILIVATTLVVNLVQRPPPARQPVSGVETTVRRPVDPPLPHMSLPDGSRIYLSKSAKVQVERQDRRALHLVQHRGQVRYEVKKGLPRSFEVTVDDVRVRAVGTIFTISVVTQDVNVRVHRGQVQVSGRRRSFRLSADEQLTLPRQLQAENRVTPSDGRTAP